MSAYMEAVMQTEADLQAEAKRETLIHEAVTALLDVLDGAYPEFKKSAGPFGDKLAADIHKRIKAAFAELGKIQAEELAMLESLERKYRP